MPDIYPTNLIAQTTEFIGRKTELSLIIEHLRSVTTRLLTLTGPGGVGKTRLALQAGSTQLGAFQDGVFQVSLASIRDTQLVVSTLAHTLGLKETGQQPILDILKEFLRERKILLILDNFEQIKAASSLVFDLFENSTALKILITSRCALNIPGEIVLTVPPLETPELKNLPDPATLSQLPSVALFLHRARLVSPNFSLNSQNIATIAAICIKLDGLPLALELAAARLKILSPDQLLARLSNRFKLLTGGQPGSSGQQQTLRGTIDWSYELLNAGEKVLLSRLSIFQRGWSTEAAIQVCNLSNIQPPDLNAAQPEPTPHEIEQGLLTLYENSLVQLSSDKERFSMLESIREYAYEFLAGSGKEAVVRQSHLQYIRALVEQAEPLLTGPEQGYWYKLLELEYNNIRAALSWVLDSNLSDAMKIASSIWRFWEAYGYISEGRAYLEKCLTAQSAAVGAIFTLEEFLSDTDKAQVSLRVKTLNAAGVLARDQSDLGVAELLLMEGLNLQRKLEDKKTLSNLLNTLASVIAIRGDYHRALELHQENLVLRREVSDKRGEAVTLTHLAVLMYQLGGYDDLRPYYEEPLSILRQIGDSRGVALVLNNYGEYLRTHGYYNEALPCIEESYSLRQQLGDRNGMIASLISMGDIFYVKENYVQATEYFRQSLKILQEIGDGRQTAMCLEGVANVSRKLGRPWEAARFIGAAAALRESIGSPLDTAMQAEYELSLEATKALMTEEDFQLAWSLGQNLPLEQTLALVIAVESLT